MKKNLIIIFILTGCFIYAQYLDIENAVRFNKTEIINQYLSNENNLHAKDANGRTIFHLAAYYNNCQLITLLIGEKAGLEAKDNNGNTPLNLAADNGSLEACSLLLKNKADINTQNKWGSTPLHLAVRYNHINAVKCMLEFFPDINIRDKNKDTPYDLAVKNQSADMKNLLDAYIAESAKKNNRIYKTVLYEMIKRFKTSGQPMNFGFWADEFYFANIDRDRTDEEAVIGIKYHTGEGCYEYYLCVLKGFIIMYFEPVTGGYEGWDSYIRTVDMDNDQTSEIIVVGESGTYRETIDIKILKYNNGKFQDIIYGSDFAGSYFYTDIDGDFKKELIGIRHEKIYELNKYTSSTKDIIVLKQDVSGYFKKIEIADKGRVLLQLLDDAVMNENIEFITSHDGDDFIALVSGVKKYGGSPSDLKSYQAKIEKIYAEHSLSQLAFAAGFKGNNYAIGFLKTIIEKKENKNNSNRVYAASSLDEVSSGRMNDYLFDVFKKEIGEDYDEKLCDEINRIMHIKGDDRSLKYYFNFFKKRGFDDFHFNSEYSYFAYFNLNDNADTEAKAKIVNLINENYFSNYGILDSNEWNALIYDKIEKVRSSAARALYYYKNNNALKDLMQLFKTEKSQAVLDEIYGCFLSELIKDKELLNKAEYHAVFKNILLKKYIPDEHKKVIFTAFNDSLTDNEISILFNNAVSGFTLQSDYIASLAEIIQKRKITLNTDFSEIINMSFYNDYSETVSVLKNIVLCMNESYMEKFKEILRKNIDFWDEVKNDRAYISIIFLGILKDTESEDNLKKIFFMKKREQYDFRLENAKEAIAIYFGLMNTEPSKQLLLDNIENGLRNIDTYPYALYLLNDVHVIELLCQKIDKLEKNYAKNIYKIKKILVSASEAVYLADKKKGLDLFLKYTDPAYPEELRVSAILKIIELNETKNASVINTFKKLKDDNLRSVRSLFD